MSKFKHSSLLKIALFSGVLAPLSGGAGNPEKSEPESIKESVILEKVRASADRIEKHIKEVSMLQQTKMINDGVIRNLQSL